MMSGRNMLNMLMYLYCFYISHNKPIRNLTNNLNFTARVA